MMRLSLFQSLRSRLVALLLAASALALALLFFHSLGDRRREIAHAQEKALHLARLAASRQEMKIAQGGYLLATLSKLPAVKSCQQDAFHHLAASLHSEYPWIGALGVADPEGRVLCGFAPKDIPPSLADRPGFRKALETGEFSLGAYTVSRSTGKPALPLVYPSLDGSGQVARVLFLLIDLEWLNAFPGDAQLPPGTTVTVVDRRGQVLIHQPDGERWVGKSVLETALGRHMLERRAQGESQGLADLPDPAGTRRLYAFLPLRGEEEGAPFLAVGIPAAEAYGPANRALAFQAAFLGLGTGLILLFAWWGANLAVVRPMRRLSASIRRLAGGDLSARTDPVSGAREIWGAFVEFNRMAEKLEGEASGRRWAEELLRESERRYRSLFVNSVNGALLTGDDGRVLEANPQACLMLGYSREEIIGLDKKEILGPSAPPLAKALEEWERTGRAMAELDLPRKDGSRMAAVVSFTQFEGRDGRPRMTLILREVSRQKAAEEALLRSEQKFRQIFEVETDALFFVEISTRRILEVNPSAWRLYGYQREELLGRSILDLSAEPEKSYRAVENRETFVPLRLNRRKDGTVFPVEIAFSYFSWEGKEVYVSAVREISARVRAEEELARESALNASMALLAGRLLEARSVEEMAGLALEEAKNLTGSRAGRVCFPDRGYESAAAPAEDGNNGEGRQDSAGDRPVEKPSPPCRWGLGSKAPLLANDPAGAPGGPCERLGGSTPVRRFLSAPVLDGSRLAGRICVAGAPGDYAPGDLATLERLASLFALGYRRKRSEEALSRSEQKFRQLFEMESDALYFTDLETRLILEANPATSRLYGYSREELLGKSILDLSAEPEKSARTLETRETRIPFRFHRHKDGTIFPVEVALSYFNWEGRPSYLAAIRDISARTKAEAELERLLAQAQRSRGMVRRMAQRLMEAQEAERRQVSRELHDKVGQSLSALSLNLAIIRSLAPSSLEERIDARLRDSQAILEGMAVQVRNVMADLRPPLLDDYGLGAALRGYGKKFEDRTGIRVSVREKGPPFRLPVSTELALFRIVQEALSNVSRHAKASNVSITLVEEGGLLRLTVADNGKGFDPSLRAGGSAGMGLTAMRERAEAIGAWLVVPSKIGAGTQVVVELRHPPGTEAGRAESN